MAGCLAFFVIGVAIGTSCGAKLRWFGTLLQLAGLTTVALGLASLRREFRRNTTLQGLWDWLRQAWAAVQPPQIVNLEAHLSGSVTVTGDLSAILKLGADASIEQRLTEVERLVGALRSDLTTESNQRKQVLAGLEAALHREAASRAEAQKDLARKVEKISVGGLSLEKVGLVWLILGVVCASISEEIAAFFALCSAV